MSGIASTVSGEVCLLERLDAPGGTLRISVADVSRVDAPGLVVADQQIALDEPLAAGAQVPFTLTVPAVESKASYIVQAHLDTTGSSTITPGDRISMRAYPVLTGGYPASVTIEVRTV